ncbi:MAG: glucose-1-phosphate thymidylyltransferase, partial [Euryarchaeota archaeon]|nr:glucose-1-phosphate thymidylyltransferase [Euryarchaeota archaeon]
VTEVGVILGLNGREQVIERIGDGSNYGVNVCYIDQGAPLGIAHAVACAEDFLADEPFVVYLGDNILRHGIAPLVAEYDEGQCDAVIALQRVPNPERYGVAEVDEVGRLIQLVEKPQKPKSDLALVGVYLFTSPIFEAIRQIQPSWRNELEITDAIQRLIDTRYIVKHHVIQGWWKDTGMPEDILEVNRLLLDDLVPLVEGTIEEGAILKGRVSVGKGSVLKSGCTVFGPTIIGENCTIDAGTYIGPYTSIGDRTHVSGAHIEDSIVIGESVITCRKTIVESLIGDKTQIRSTDQKLPKGHRLIVGSGSSIDL